MTIYTVHLLVGEVELHTNDFSSPEVAYSNAVECMQHGLAYKHTLKSDVKTRPEFGGDGLVPMPTTEELTLEQLRAEIKK
jgi:hypothetical protein